MTLRRQMIFMIALPTLMIYVIILGLAMLYAYRQSKAEVERSMTQLAASYASRFDGALREAAQIAESTAAFIETAGAPADDKIYELLEGNVARSPLVYGACMAFEPGALKPADVLFAPYVCRDGHGFRRVNIDQSVYDWYRDPAYTWFTTPRSLNHGVWSEPYFDEGAGNVLMATYSAPFDLNGKFGGVNTVDIDLPQLHRTIGSAFDQDLDFVILSSDGSFVFDPDSSRILTKTIFDVAAETQNPALADLGHRMVSGASGVAAIDRWDSTERQWVFYAPIGSTRWVFATRFPESAALAEVQRRSAWGAAVLGITLLLIVACIVIVSRLLARPIVRLKEKVAEVAQGNLDVQIEQTGHTDELRQLAHGFNAMTSELRSHVEKLGAEQAARARVEHDLEIARQIQQSLLPAEDPTDTRVDIAGRSRYCDATGGDYYDFIDVARPASGTALIAIGDVTGHGIAAALLMASARAALRIQAVGAGQLSLMLTAVNRLLASDNRHDRFMTMTLMMIDPDDRTVRWASAGHDPAIVFHCDSQSFEELDGGDLPLGIDPDTIYEEYQSNSLCVGDILILGTDGIWETQNAGGEMFGKDRLRDLIREFSQQPVQEMAAAIEQRLDHYRGEGIQKDDITFVLVRLK